MFAFLAFGYIACLMYKINPIASVVLGFVPILLFVIVSLFSLLSYLHIKLFMSNFVITDLRDNMIIPQTELSISRQGLKCIRLHTSNIYETELDGERYCLYLAEKGKTDLKMHICGIEGEQEQFLSLIREKQKRGETVTLPLTFEGKFAGSAEVIEAF